MEHPGAGNLAEALAISATAELDSPPQQQQQQQPSLGVRRGSGISPLLAPPDGGLSPTASGAGTSTQAQSVSPRAVPLPTTHQHSRGPSELGASENGMGPDDDGGTADLDSTHRTASPHPQHSAAASSMRTMPQDDDDQTFTFTQTVDHHTLAAGAVTVDQAELSLEQRMPTAAQELTAGSQGGAFGDGTATLLADPDATATAGITENNAFLQSSRGGGPDASTMSAAVESGSALRHRMDTDGVTEGAANGDHADGRGDDGDATFSDPEGADSTDQSPLAPVHTRVASDPLDMSNSAGAAAAARRGSLGGGLPPPLVGMGAVDSAIQPTYDGNGTPVIGQRRRRSSASPNDASVAMGATGVSRTLSLRDIRLPIDDPAVAASASRVTTPAPAGGSAEKDHIASGERGSRGDDNDAESTPSRSPCSVNLADI
jgi:hypothetical protein